MERHIYPRPDISYPDFIGFLHPNTYLSHKRDTVFHPDRISNVVQVVHVLNHWVCITNFNPKYYNDFIPEEDHCKIRRWFLYDSLNMQEFYLPYLKPFLKRHNCESGEVQVITCDVIRQQPHPMYNEIDCGLFALGYAQVLCQHEFKEIAHIHFDQQSMRTKFNNSISASLLDPFDYTIKNSPITWKTFTVDLSDLTLNW